MGTSCAWKCPKLCHGWGATNSISRKQNSQEISSVASERASVLACRCVFPFLMHSAFMLICRRSIRWLVQNASASDALTKRDRIIKNLPDNRIVLIRLTWLAVIYVNALSRSFDHPTMWAFQNCFFRVCVCLSHSLWSSILHTFSSCPQFFQRPKLSRHENNHWIGTGRLASEQVLWNNNKKGRKVSFRQATISLSRTPCSSGLSAWKQRQLDYQKAPAAIVRVSCPWLV